MAVTLTVAQLAAAMRVGDSTIETLEVTRLLDYGKEAVSKHLGDAFAGAPEVAVNEAVVRLASYLYDMPNAGRREGWANAMRNSGAARMLLPYRIHRAGSVGDMVEAARASGSPGNPVTNVTVSGGQLTVSFADGTSESYPIAGGDDVRFPDPPAEGSAVPESVDGAVRWRTVAQLTGGRLPAQAVPGLAVATRGYVLAQSADGETWALIELEAVPAAGAQRAGRVLAVGSAGSPFWDLPHDVVLRALGDLSGQQGRVLAVNAAEDDFELVDVSGARSRPDQVARAATMVNARHIDALDFTVDTYAVGLAGLPLWSIASWDAPDDAADDAGVALAFWVQGSDPTAYSELQWRTTQFNVGSAANRLWALRVPTGYPVEYARMNWVRSGVSAPQPMGDGYWAPFGLTGVPSNYDVYYLARANAEFEAIAVQSGDRISAQLATLEPSNPLAPLQHAVAQAVRDIDSITVHEIGTVFADTTSDDREASAGYEEKADATGDQSSGQPLFTFPAASRPIGHLDFTGSGASVFPGLFLYHGYDPRAYRIVHTRGGSTVATYPASGQYWKLARRHPSGDLAYILAAELSDAGITVNARQGDTFQIQRASQVTKLFVEVADLGDAARARLLPAPSLGNKGKFAAIKPDGTAWEVVDAPAGGGGFAWTSIGTFSRSGTSYVAPQAVATALINKLAERPTTEALAVRGFIRSGRAPATTNNWFTGMIPLAGVTFDTNPIGVQDYLLPFMFGVDRDDPMETHYLFIEDTHTDSPSARIYRESGGALAMTSVIVYVV